MPIYFSLNTEFTKIYPVYLTTTGTYYSESESDRPEGFSDYQFLLTVEGEGLLEFGEQEISLKPGILLFIPPDTPHKYYKTEGKWLTHWLTFHGNNVDELLETVLPNDIEIIKVDIKNQIYSRMIEVNNLTYTNYQNNSLKISAIIYSMIADFTSLLIKRDQHNFKQSVSQVERVIRYMEENFSNDIVLEEMASHVDISPQYLCRIFKDQLGLRPFEYLRQLRINRSKTLLIEDDSLLIEDIAKRVGFNNPSYYGSIFRQYEDMSPREFVKMHKK